MAEQFRILGIPGSLRSGSYNHGLLRAAGELAPPGVSVELYDISTIPLYDADIDLDGGPLPVRAFKEAIQRADGLLITTPEYIASMSGVLKNALDWASRPAATTVLRHKPIGIAGVSPGGSGTVKAQLALRQALLSTKSHTLIEPELYVAGAKEKFADDGTLNDEATREQVRGWVAALVAWGRLLRNGAAG